MKLPQKQFEFSAIGRTFRVTTCEHCRAEFIHVVAFEHTGNAVSQLFLNNEGAEQEAQQQAIAMLEESLAHGVVPVPCPECGNYQRAMVEHLQGLRTNLSGMLLFLSVVIAGLGLLYCGIAVLVQLGRQNAGLPGPFHWRLIGQVALGLIALPFAATILYALQYWRASLYDPNAGNPTERIALSRQLAVTVTSEQANPQLLRALLEKSDARQLRRVRKGVAKESRFNMAISLAVVGICCWALIATSDRWLTGLPTLLWPSVKGHMNGANWNWEDKGRERHYWPVVSYSYEVNGQHYEGKNYRLTPNISLFKSTTLEIVKQLNKSPTVTVYYNPRNPAESVLARGVPFTHGIITLVVVGLGLAMIARVITEWRRNVPLDALSTIP